MDVWLYLSTGNVGRWKVFSERNHCKSCCWSCSKENPQEIFWDGGVFMIFVTEIILFKFIMKLYFYAKTVISEFYKMIRFLHMSLKCIMLDFQNIWWIMSLWTLIRYTNLFCSKIYTLDLDFWSFGTRANQWLPWICRFCFSHPIWVFKIFDSLKKKNWYEIFFFRLILWKILKKIKYN